MAQAIFGHTGEVTGWLDGEDVRDTAGRARAFIDRGILVGYDGRGTLGSFEDGTLRDTDGAVFGVLAGATGVLRPTLSTTPEPPPFEPRPPRPSPPPRPRWSPRLREWSGRALDDVLP
jgi:hypothetical protein